MKRVFEDEHTHSAENAGLHTGVARPLDPDAIGISSQTPPTPIASAESAASTASPAATATTYFSRLLPHVIFFLCPAGAVFLYKYKKKKTAFDETNPGQVAMAWPIYPQVSSRWP